MRLQAVNWYAWVTFADHRRPSSASSAARRRHGACIERKTENTRTTTANRSTARKHAGTKADSDAYLQDKGYAHSSRLHPDLTFPAVKKMYEHRKGYGRNAWPSRLAKGAKAFTTRTATAKLTTDPKTSSFGLTASRPANASSTRWPSPSRYLPCTPSSQRLLVPSFDILPPRPPHL